MTDSTIPPNPGHPKPDAAGDALAKTVIAVADLWDVGSDANHRLRGVSRTVSVS